METDLQGLKNKEFLLMCINSAIKKINANKKRVRGAKLELYEGLTRIPGNAEVARQMFAQIDECNLFIGDFTVVQKICNRYKRFVNKKGVYFRYTPNCNVYGEYNRALGKNENFWKQVILVMNKVNGNPHEDAQEIPFDTRERRMPITFELTDFSDEGQAKARAKLEPVLENAIVKSANAALENLGAHYAPFESWYEQHKDHRYNFSEIDNSFIKQHQSTILNEKDPILITAPESKLNTILVHRIFDGQDEMVNYLYVNCKDSDVKDVKDTALKILRNEYDKENLILVIDKCDSELFNHILNLKQKYSAHSKIIAIFNKPTLEAGSRFDYSYKQIDLKESVDVINKSALDVVGVKSALQQDSIGQFCENDPLLVKRIATRISPEERTELPNATKLVTKLTDAQPKSNERTILQALSIFDYIGWKEDRKKELEFILSNKNITNSEEEPSRLVNEAEKVISKNIKLGYISERGRTVSITSAPLVKQLVTEWLSKTDVEKFYQLLQDLTSTEIKGLSREFHDRLITLDQNENVRAILAQLFTEGGHLYEDEFVDSESGSLFIGAFAEIMPDLVTSFLADYILSKPIDQLKNFENGRRNVVWTLQKLCFISDLFEKSAECMLRLGVAENETWSNNASGEFRSLFSIYLPATEANLELRLKCLNKWFEIDEYKQLVINALSRATHTSDYICFGGSETCGSTKRENYQPKTREEIIEYLIGCLSLLLKEIKGNTQHTPTAIKALENNVGVMCKSGYGSLILPVIKEVADLKHNDWDTMFYNLSLFKDRLFPYLTPDCQTEYDEVINSLRKDDIVSRFSRVEKEIFYSSDTNFENRERILHEKYAELANEVYETKSFSKDIIEGLLTVECISSFPFGNELAKRMDDEEQRSFVKNCIDIINDNEKAKPSLLIDFVSELPADLFDELIPVLADSRISYVLFSCFGRKSILPSNPQFQFLSLQIKNSKAKVDDFNQYWCSIRINLLTDNVVYDIFNEVLSHQGGIETVMHMSVFLGFDGSIGHYTKVAGLLSSTLTSSKDIQDGIIRDVQTLHISSVLLKFYDLPDLAAVINKKIIDSASDYTTYFSPNYEVEELYRILMVKYFNTIWPQLSKSLASDSEHYMTYHNLKSFLGSSIVDQRTPIIMEGNHFSEMLEWCDQYPNIAPARLAGMITVAIGEKFTEEAISLIDRYADRPYVLNELECSLDSFSSVGSVVPYYERRKKIYDTMLEHNNATVREWAKKQSDACDYLMHRESVAEEEKF